MLTTLPLFHVNAPAYSVMGSLACGAGLVLAERFSASAFLDTARRHGATEFNAIGAMLEILMRQPERPDDAAYAAAAVLHRARARAGTAAGDRAAVRPADRRRLRHVGVAVRADLAARQRGRTAPSGRCGSIRCSASSTRRGSWATTGTVTGPGGSGELELRNPVLTPGLLGHARGDGGAQPRWLAAHRRPGHRQARTAPTPSSPGSRRSSGAAARTCRRWRSRRCSAAHPAVLECAVVGVPSELSEEEVKAFVVADRGRRAAGLRRAARVRRGPAGRLQGAAVLAAGQRAAADANRPGCQAPAARPGTRRRSMTPRRPPRQPSPATSREGEQ